MMRTGLIGAVILTGMMLAMTGSQDPMQQLRDENQKLQKRVTELESWLRMLRVDPNNPPPAPAARPGDGLLVIEEIMKARPTESQRKRIAELEEDIKDAKAIIKQLDGRQRDDRTGATRDRLLEARKNLRDYERELLLIETRFRDAYWIMGWDGQRDVMLFLDGMREEYIRAINLGQHVTWTGKLLDTALGHPVDSDYAIYETPRVEFVAPGSPVVRPSRREPVWSQTGAIPSELPRIPF